MSGRQHPLPPSVYRRRRLTVFGGFLVLVAVVVLIIVRPGFGGSAQQDVEAEETVEEVVVPPPACTSSQIKLTAQTDALRYNPGEIPQMWLTVENVGFQECEIEVGPASQEYLITSGPRSNPDRIWSSKDCQRGGVPMTITLAPGDSRSTEAIAWDRTRSGATTCDEARPIQPGGGASYHLQVLLGDFQSAETRQFILN
jgi:hypothetical protein